MSPSSPRFIGMHVHKGSIPVADVAQDHGAEVISLRATGTRPCDIDQLVRQMPSQATHLIFVYEAGPCGDWLSRYLTPKGDACWVVAPSLSPKKAGDRVTTTRRDAVQLARWARSAALTAGYVPTVDDAAMRALTRARAKGRSALKEVKFRLKALLLSQDIRFVGRATCGSAPLRWFSEVVCPTPVQQLVFHEDVRAVHERPNTSSV